MPTEELQKYINKAVNDKVAEAVKTILADITKINCKIETIATDIKILKEGDNL